jgi:DNA polymerase (family 10)
MIGKLSNTEVAQKLLRIGQLYQLKKDRWRARAFLDASKIVEDLPEHVMELDLLAIEGIGQAIDSVIQDLCATGTSTKLERLEAEFPDAALDFTFMPGIGPVKAEQLAARWGVTTMDELLFVLEDSGLEDSELYNRILDGLARKKQGRLSRFAVASLVERLVFALGECPHIDRVEVAGSWRRRRLTVKDLDVLIGADAGWKDLAVEEARSVAERYGTLESAGETKIRFRHVGEKFSIDVDFLVVDIDCWGSALNYFTGSKMHNERLRAIAKAVGLKVNEYGIFRGDIRIGGTDEHDLYEILGLEYAEPHDREN